MSQLRPRSLAAVAIAASASLLLAGCGTVLREDAIPEVLPTTTTMPSALPEGTVPVDEEFGGERPQAPIQPLPDGAVPVQSVPTTVPDDSTYIDRQELDGLVSPDAPSVCRAGAALAYWSAEALNAALDPQTGLPLDAVDEGFVQRSLLEAVAALEVAVPLLDDSDVVLTSRERIDDAVAELRRTVEQPDPAAPLALQFREWWLTNGNDMTGVASGLGVLCKGQPFTRYLSLWR